MVLVNPPADLFAGYLQVTRASRGEPRPARAALARDAAPSSVRVRAPTSARCSSRRRPASSPTSPEQMLRSPRTPLPTGTRLALTGVTIEVTASLPDGRPAEVRFTFDVPLDDPSLVWAAWQRTGYVRFTPPAVGEEVTLPPSDFLKALFPPPK